MSIDYKVELEFGMVSVRGATTVRENSKENILIETEILLKEILKVNKIEIDDIISCFFTMTKDLDKVYPAVAARKLGIVNASLMCYDELYIENSMEKCIRIMIQFNSNKKQKDVQHIYMNEAKKLRPDIVRGE
ncbi:MAG: chorismate mutase [Lachnospirales bacterium]